MTRTAPMLLLRWSSAIALAAVFLLLCLEPMVHAGIEARGRGNYTISRSFYSNRLRGLGDHEFISCIACLVLYGTVWCRAMGVRVPAILVLAGAIYGLRWSENNTVPHAVCMGLIILSTGVLTTTVTGSIWPIVVMVWPYVVCFSTYCMSRIAPSAAVHPFFWNLMLFSQVWFISLWTGYVLLAGLYTAATPATRERPPRVLSARTHTAAP